MVYRSAFYHTDTDHVEAPLAAISEHRLQQRHGLLTAAYNKEEEEEEEEEEFTETSQFKGKRLFEGCR